jgi:hypothetical protein
MPLRLQHSIYVPILSGTAASTIYVDLRLIEPVSLIMPSAWTAAALSFFISPDGINVGWMANANGKIFKISPAQANYAYDLPSSSFDGAAFLAFISGDLSLGLSGLVNQAADRVLVLNCRDRAGLS